MNFLDLGLSEKTVKAINECGIEKPTTVQVDVIPAILQGKDIFTIAPGGCGKTVSYVLPLIDIISRREKLNILIMTSDSQKSVTISDSLAMLNRFHEETEEDADGEEEGDVIIGSPDLLVDLVNEGQIDLSKINILVVDDINLIKKKQTNQKHGKAVGNDAGGQTKHRLHQPPFQRNPKHSRQNLKSAGRNQSRQKQRAGSQNVGAGRGSSGQTGSAGTTAQKRRAGPGSVGSVQKIQLFSGQNPKISA